MRGFALIYFNSPFLCEAITASYMANIDVSSAKVAVLCCLMLVGGWCR
jgi:hypothetical protein